MMAERSEGRSLKHGELKPGELRGEWNTAGLRFGIVVSDFNRFITDRLLTGVLDAMGRAGATEEQIQVVRVPGAFEIPITAKKLAGTGRVDSIVCVGCILRGETSHYDYVASETSRGIQLAQIDTGVPMIFCVLTCDTLEQAIDRAGLKGGNKGYEAGVAAIEMAQISKKLLAEPSKPSGGGRRRRG
jgi:6,7-dimethyl-8-ribityllumazine synthase